MHYWITQYNIIFLILFAGQLVKPLKHTSVHIHTIYIINSGNPPQRNSTAKINDALKVKHAKHQTDVPSMSGWSKM